METEPRRLRADAERNRRRVIEAASAMFAERGLEVGVGEIAERAGVGRGTLFRNFPTKEALIAAVLALRIDESIQRARDWLAEPDPATALSGMIDEIVGRSQTDRMLTTGLSDEWMSRPEIRSAHDEGIAVIEQILARAQAAGAARTDVGAVDVLLLIKGVCECGHAFSGIPAEIGMRQIDLVKAAIAAPGGPTVALRGRPPTAGDLEVIAPAGEATTVGPAPEPAAGGLRRSPTARRR